jgi:hypothetical protein
MEELIKHNSINLFKEDVKKNMKGFNGKIKRRSDAEEQKNNMLQNTPRTIKHLGKEL